MANIRPRKNKDGKIISYQIRVFRGKDMTGKQLKPYVMNWKVPKDMTQAKILKEVNKVATIFEKQCKDGIVSTENVRFCDYADYVISIKERDGKRRTIERYKELLGRINQYIGNLKLKDIKSEHLNKFYLELSKKGSNLRTGGILSAKTIQEYHRLIHTILAQAVKEDLVLFNVADKSTPPKVEKKEAEAFTIDEMKEIVSCLNNEPLKWRLMTYLLISTGARRGEVMGLKWINIDFINYKIKIKTTLYYAKDIGVYEDTPKTHQSRVVDIDVHVTKLLREYMEVQQELFKAQNKTWSPDNFVFLQDDLKPCIPDCINGYLKRFEKKYNLPHINPHKFRHTQASILYASNINPIKISKRLGHSNLSTTQDIYTHLIDESQADETNAITTLIYSSVEEEEKKKVLS